MRIKFHEFICFEEKNNLPSKKSIKADLLILKLIVKIDRRCNINSLNLLSYYCLKPITIETMSTYFINLNRTSM